MKNENIQLTDQFTAEVKVEVRYPEGFNVFSTILDKQGYIVSIINLGITHELHKATRRLEAILEDEKRRASTDIDNYINLQHRKLDRDDWSTLITNGIIANNLLFDSLKQTIDELPLTQES